MTDMTQDVVDRKGSGPPGAGRAGKAQRVSGVGLVAGEHHAVSKRATRSGIVRIEMAAGRAYGALACGLPQER